jgi:hypothetical protein
MRYTTEWLQLRFHQPVSATLGRIFIYDTHVYKP